MEEPSSHRNGLLGLAGLTALYAIALLFLPDAHTGDDTCGPIVARNFLWSRQQCGIAYSGAAATSALLGGLALSLVVLALKAPQRIGVAVITLAVASALAVGAFIALWGMTAALHYGDGELGWTANRNLVGFAALYLIVITVVTSLGTRRDP